MILLRKKYDKIKANIVLQKEKHETALHKRKIGSYSNKRSNNENSAYKRERSAKKVNL